MFETRSGLSRKGESHPLALVVTGRALLEASSFIVLTDPGGTGSEHPLLALYMGLAAPVLHGAWLAKCDDSIIRYFSHTRNLNLSGLNYRMCCFSIWYHVQWNL